MKQPYLDTYDSDDQPSDYDSINCKTSCEDHKDLPLNDRAVFAQVIVGPPGSGKTTFSNGMTLFMQGIGRNAIRINLDPANPYSDATVDVCSLVSHADIAEQDDLGPNGALIRCFELLSGELLDDLLRLIHDAINTSDQSNEAKETTLPSNNCSNKQTQQNQNVQKHNEITPNYTGLHKQHSFNDEPNVAIDTMDNSFLIAQQLEDNECLTDHSIPSDEFSHSDSDFDPHSYEEHQYNEHFIHTKPSFNQSCHHNAPYNTPHTATGIDYTGQFFMNKRKPGCLGTGLFDRFIIHKQAVSGITLGCFALHFSCTMIVQVCTKSYRLFTSPIDRGPQSSQWEFFHQYIALAIYGFLCCPLLLCRLRNLEDAFGIKKDLILCTILAGPFYCLVIFWRHAPVMRPVQAICPSWLLVTLMLLAFHLRTIFWPSLVAMRRRRARGRSLLPPMGGIFAILNRLNSKTSKKSTGCWPFNHFRCNKTSCNVNSNSSRSSVNSTKAMTSKDTTSNAFIRRRSSVHLNIPMANTNQQRQQSKTSTKDDKMTTDQSSSAKATTAVPLTIIPSKNTVVITFRQVLQDSVLLARFRRFTVQEFSVENIFFYEVIEEFRQLCRHPVAARREFLVDRSIQNIYQCFFLPKSRYEVNVSDAVRQGILDCMHANGIADDLTLLAYPSSQGQQLKTCHVVEIRIDSEEGEQEISDSCSSSCNSQDQQAAIPSVKDSQYQGNTTSIQQQKSIKQHSDHCKDKKTTESQHMKSHTVCQNNSSTNFPHSKSHTMCHKNSSPESQHTTKRYSISRNSCSTESQPVRSSHRMSHNDSSTESQYTKNQYVMQKTTEPSHSTIITNTDNTGIEDRSARLASIFDDAQAEVYRMMEDWTFPRFLKYLRMPPDRLDRSPYDGIQMASSSSVMTPSYAIPNSYNTSSWHPHHSYPYTDKSHHNHNNTKALHTSIHSKRTNSNDNDENIHCPSLVSQGRQHQMAGMMSLDSSIMATPRHPLASKTPSNPF